MSSTPTRVLAGVTVPDTPIVTKALAYARKFSTDQVYNHIVRSWLFGVVIAPQVYPLVDLETLSVALILHDLGWETTGTLTTLDMRFEIDSANAARQFLILEAPSWDVHRVQLVWDAIALHSTASIALFKQPEVAGACAGILADISGPKKAIGGVLTSEQYIEVIEEFPMLGLKEGIIEIFCGFCKTKPETTYNNFLSEFGDTFVEGYSSKGKKEMDFILAPIEM